MIQIGLALWPVAMRADVLEPRATWHVRCLECPTLGVCQAKGHTPTIRTFDVESPADARGESS